MKLKKGIKPLDLEIPRTIAHRIQRTGDYIEIEIDDTQQITKLRAMGFSNL